MKASIQTTAMRSYCHTIAHVNLLSSICLFQKISYICTALIAGESYITMLRVFMEDLQFNVSLNRKKKQPLMSLPPATIV